MPKFMGGFSNKNSWTRQASVPRCNPSRAEQMTLVEAAREQNKKNRNDLSAANQRLKQAQGREDWKEVKKIAKEIRQIKARR